MLNYKIREMKGKLSGLEILEEFKNNPKKEEYDSLVNEMAKCYYFDGIGMSKPPNVPITQTSITLQDLSTNINGTLRTIEPGRPNGPINEGDNRYYGTDGNLSMFEYKWFAGHWHTEGKPSSRCWNQTSENVFRSQAATAHQRGIAELGNLFARNANLIYLLGVNQYQFVRTGGHGSGGPVLVGGPGGTNLVQGQLGQWHNAPYLNPIELHSAPNVNM